MQEQAAANGDAHPEHHGRGAFILTLLEWAAEPGRCWDSACGITPPQMVMKPAVPAVNETGGQLIVEYSTE